MTAAERQAENKTALVMQKRMANRLAAALAGLKGRHAQGAAQVAEEEEGMRQAAAAAEAAMAALRTKAETFRRADEAEVQKVSRRSMFKSNTA